MADIAIFRINYKSDFILTLQSDAGWLTPFCIKFWTGEPSQAYFAGYDGTTYTHCAPVDGDPTKLSVQFDDHHLPIGDLKFQIGYHFTVADFPTSIEDEVINQAAVIIDNDGEQQQVMLDFNGETAPDIAFSLPAYANEAQRIANEQVRIAAEEQRVSNEQQRISNEEGRISAEERRQEHEQQRIHNEEIRIAEFARLEADAIAATGAANDAATLANEKAQLAADKAALAQSAATLANDKAQLAADKAALAQAAATLANDKAALAQQKADYAQAQGDYAKAQSDIALADHERAETDHERAEADHDTATDDHTTATSDHTQAESDHTRAEADHTTAASDHTQASSDHDRAESDHTKAGQDHDRAESDHTTAAADHTRAESDHAAVEVYVDSLGAFDISAYHATGGVLAKYADLTAALGTNGANIPDELRKGGMSVKFVLSSDNNYVQFRYMLPYGGNTTAENNKFVNTANWQGVDNVPTAGSDNLMKSGGVYAFIEYGENTPIDPTLVSKTNANINPSNNDWQKVDKVYCRIIPITETGDYTITAVNGLAAFAVLTTNTVTIGNPASYASGYSLVNLSRGESVTVNITSGLFLYVRDDNNQTSGRILPTIVLGIANPVIRESDLQGIGKKVIKCLFIGNSVNQDHIGYLPWLLRNAYGNTIDFTIAIAYKASYTIKEYVENIMTGNVNLDIFSIANNNESWTNYNDYPFANIWANFGNFDLISFEGYFNHGTESAGMVEDVTYFNTFIDNLITVNTTPFKVGYLMHQTYNYTTHTEEEAWERIVNGAKYAISDTPVSILFPCGAVTKIVNGEIPQSMLTNDNIHNQQGLPCIMGAYVVMEELSRYYGTQSKIIGNSSRITATTEDALNIPGKNGTLQVGTDSQYILCQKAAIKAVKWGDYLVITNSNELL